MLETTLQDIRYALRTLARKPAFTMAAVLTLALGIGANTAIFGLVDTALLRGPVGVAEPERVVRLYTSDFSGPPFGASSYPDVEYLHESNAFEGVAAWTGANVAYATGDRAVAVSGLAVSANYFEVLGARAALGRVFRPDEEDTAGNIVVVSNGFWLRELGGQSEIVGSVIRINGVQLEVVGVTEAGFSGITRGTAPDLWLPVRTAQRVNGLFVDPDRRTSRGFQAVARLAPGVTLERARESMNVAAQQLHDIDPGAWTDVQDEVRRITVLSEREARVPPNSRALVLDVAGVLAGAAALVLLLCCANVAGLLIARATGRTREIGIRLTLGAGRIRLVRQLFTESIVLALAGGTVGVRIALGARPPEVIGLFLRQALPIVAAGGLAGVLAALAATRAMRSLLIGVAPTDPISWAAATFMLILVALLASWLPARRATRVDPMVALRSD